MLTCFTKTLEPATSCYGTSLCALRMTARRTSADGKPWRGLHRYWRPHLLSAGHCDFDLRRNLPKFSAAHHTTAGQNSLKPNAGQGKRNRLALAPLRLPTSRCPSIPTRQPYHISSVTPRTPKSGLSGRVDHRRSLVLFLSQSAGRNYRLTIHCARAFLPVFPYHKTKPVTSTSRFALDQTRHLPSAGAQGF